MPSISFLPDELRTLRLTRRMKQGEFWGPLGHTEATGGLFERGQKSLPPSLGLIVRLATAPEAEALQALHRLRERYAAKERLAEGEAPTLPVKGVPRGRHGKQSGEPQIFAGLPFGILP